MTDSKTATELLPCPFCGGEAKEYVRDYGDTHYWRVSCSSDRCGVNPVTNVYVTAEGAIKAWNTRAEVGMSYEDISIMMDELGVSEWTMTDNKTAPEPCTLQHGKVQGRTKSDKIGQDLSKHADAPCTSRDNALGAGECKMEYGGDVTEDTKRVLGVYFCSDCGSPNYNDCMPYHCIYCGKAVKANQDTRWFELFGTPEKAADTLSPDDMSCKYCLLHDYCDDGCLIEERGKLLEWLRGKAVES